jgi:hypothetical protein
MLAAHKWWGKHGVDYYMDDVGCIWQENEKFGLAAHHLCINYCHPLRRQGRPLVQYFVVTIQVSMLANIIAYY